MTDTNALSEPFSRIASDDEEAVALSAGSDLLESWRATERSCPDADSRGSSTAPPVAAEGTDDPAAKESDPPDERSRRRLRFRTILVAALVLSLIGVTGWLGWDRLQSNNLTSARAAATRSAVAVATKMADYSYQSLSKDFAAVEEASTPAFGQTFKKQSASLISVLQKYQAASSGQVSDAAVEKWSTSRAEILVIVSQTVKNTATSSPSPQENALLLSMVHQHGRWLLDRVSVR